MRRMWAIMIKEFLQIGRDRLSLAMLVAMPSMLLLLYGYALSFDVKHIRTAVLDEDCSRESRQFLDSLFQNQYFDRVGSPESRGEIDLWLRRGKARMVLVIPRGFARQLSGGERATVQALIDGTDSTTGHVAVGYLESLSGRAAAAAIGKAGVSMPETAGAGIRLEPRILFNPELTSAKFLVPGLIGMLLMLSAVIATSVSIVREKERQTIEQISVSPVQPRELILGKILPYVAICFVTMVFVLLIGYVFFGVAVRGSYLLLGIATLCFLFAALGMGLLISSVMKSQQEAFQIAMLSTLLPSIILSGFIFPISSMPRLIQAVTLLVPPRYLVSTMRAVILKDAPFSDVWFNLAAMLALGLVFNLVAMRRMRGER